MTNEELLERIANGEEAALAKLSLMNTGLVKDRARLIARQYHCLRQTKYGSLSDYAKKRSPNWRAWESWHWWSAFGPVAMMQRKAGSRLMLLPFWTEPCGGIWSAAWGRLRWIGTVWGWCERRSVFIIRKEKNPVRFVRPLAFLSVLLPEQLPTPRISSLSMICKARTMTAIFLSG